MSDRAVTLIDRGDYWLVQARPHPALRPFLRAYDGYWERDTVPSRMRTLPTRSVVVIINFGPPLRLAVPDPGTGDRDYASLAAGMYDGHGMYAHPGGQRGVHLDLTPLGAYTLLGVPMARLTNAAAELPELLGPAAALLVERLAGTPSWAARFDLLDAFLLRRLEAGPRPDPEVARAWRLLLGSAGRVPVAEIAADVGWSRRHLAHRFHEQAGLPPKVMARVLRFERAVGLARHGRALADVAAACGYYDQAHLNREFRALSGCSPTELLGGQLEPQRTATLAESL
ncbi:helix-turn-helix domain-containing protein [Actinomadura fibrosa]|uniref:Helix-turn-helix domain-containing protein n=1 Tax=Actinomadura fibrosa TaxID=111802 RepID=A0ABW2XVB2_9ACTN|nr:AraC family transcriptional regulator [Actinomadura fibrosa]